MEVVTSRFDIFLVSLDPTIGSEIKKTRPCIIVSPDEMNRHLRTVIIAPMTTKGRNYPTRIPVTFKNKKGLIVLDQLRTVDKERLVKKIGALPSSTTQKLSTALVEMFAY